MVNRKKIKAPKSLQPSRKVISQNSSSSDENTREKSVLTSITDVHLIGLLNLFVAIAYWFEFHGVANESDVSKVPCSKYLLEKMHTVYDKIVLEEETSDCISDDMFFIRLKFISMSEVIILSTSILVLAWKNDENLRRLAVYLSVCPLMINVCFFLFLARGILKEKMRTNIVMLQTGLLLLTSRTVKGKISMKSTKLLQSMISDFLLVILLLSSVAEICLKLLPKDGSDGFTQNLTTTKIGLFLYRLSAIDNATTAILINFVRHYFGTFQKKVRKSFI